MIKTTNDDVLAALNSAVKAGAYQQAAALLAAHREGLTSFEAAFKIRLTRGWDYGV